MATDIRRMTINPTITLQPMSTLQPMTTDIRATGTATHMIAEFITGRLTAEAATATAVMTCGGPTGAAEAGFGEMEAGVAPVSRITAVAVGAEVPQSGP